MSRRYTPEEKQNTLSALRANNGDISLTSAQTDVPAATLRAWERKEREQAPQRKADMVQQLQMMLLKTSIRILGEPNLRKHAPLNHRASAVGVYVDRFLKLENAAINANSEGQVIRFEFQYPDGSIHSTPQWANEDYADRDALPDSGVRTQVRQDGNGQTAADRKSTLGAETLLVDGSDLPDGEPGLARPENDDAVYSGVED